MRRRHWRWHSALICTGHGCPGYGRSTTPLRGIGDSQSRDRITPRRDDYLKAVLNPADVVDTLHPGVDRHRRKSDTVAIEADSTAWLGDVVVYCKTIAAPSERVRHDVGEPQGGKRQVTERPCDHSVPHQSLVIAAENTPPVLEPWQPGHKPKATNLPPLRSGHDCPRSPLPLGKAATLRYSSGVSIALLVTAWRMKLFRR